MNWQREGKGGEGVNKCCYIDFQLGHDLPVYAIFDSYICISIDLYGVFFFHTFTLLFRSLPTPE